VLIVYDLLLESKEFQQETEMKFIALFLCLIFYQLQFSTSETADDVKVKSKTVSTLLNAKWNSTPTALEIAEFLNDEDPSYFWAFLEDLSANVDTFSGSMS
jgi:UDP-glucose:glycoprotein glucosyltransferase